jgi:hypothetical protein
MQLEAVQKSSQQTHVSLSNDRHQKLDENLLTPLLLLLCGACVSGRKGKGPPLDGRMRKDKRGLDKAAARKKGPKGKGGVRKKGGRR